MAIVHIVLVQFKSSLDSVATLEACNKFLALKTEAVHSKTGKQYIQNITGGKNTSPEGLNSGLTHAFIVIFGSEEDRDYYLNEDPAHANFGKFLKDQVEQLIVVDYEPESF